jgi:acetyltransferase-like isoleucine patch superfamily enzyme
VTGPCVMTNEGRIEVGDGLFVRSRRHNRVEISVAREALLKLGNRVFLNQGVRIACTTNVTIGDDALLGDECVILDNDYHGIGGAESKSSPVIIEPNVWLATRVIVMRGVTIGRASVIGAGSVVTRSIPAGVFAAGVPARVIKPI